ncbi:ribosome maturation factor RimM [Phaeodactylibacter luteus]|uniref:Ribosome maturation factor RimM n=1 Tax=Phaeodactylibacter luteus TaxID=1564516 RepID=A0A5C6S1Y7_9BACT|nr:ribosome maturation factor RimM [Phaeodactylibacter luteus]TXB68857.1 16S rRNA processing protein RimM [Phaeodactylibacter luteus]
MSQGGTEFVKVGRFGKTHGHEGGIRVQVAEAYEQALLNATVLFATVGGHPAPFFLEKTLLSNPLVLKFEDIGKKEEAQPLIGQDILMRSTDLELEEAEDFHLLEGFILDEASTGEIGPIIRIEEYPQQIMATVRYGEREVLVPLHEAFIEAIDPEGKRVLMDLPEGLLEL